ncbi:MAG: PIN domain-containing protein [Candidatus Marinimicrobia bacterium]|nr:PIN domain-containing protein [Candidatus Neomarinimicrobiota bacterium]
MKIYIDNSVYNRPFDDQTQPRIWLETLAFSIILQMVVNKEINIVSSSVVNFENDKNPYPERRKWVENCLKLAVEIQAVNEEIKDRAKKLEKSGVEPIDALHLACSESANVDYFITCDDRISKNYAYKKMRILNPLEFIVNITSVER